MLITLTSTILKPAILTSGISAWAILTSTGLGLGHFALCLGRLNLGLGSFGVRRLGACRLVVFRIGIGRLAVGLSHLNLGLGCLVFFCLSLDCISLGLVPPGLGLGRLGHLILSRPYFDCLDLHLTCFGHSAFWPQTSWL